MSTHDKVRLTEPLLSLDPMLGRTVLGNYRVEKLLGSGGMGKVYRLRHIELPDTFAALKILHARAPEHAKAKDRFQQEAMVAAAVGSHRVVKPIDLGQFDDGTPYIVMEYVDGRSLDRELDEKGPLAVVAALKIAARVADTMAVAHERGIIHRDLKPPNVMLTCEGGEDDAVKLLDFGIARASGALKVAQTDERVVMGTAGYMSPEAGFGSPVDGRADVFSLGVILFEMLTGELPFPAKTLEMAITNVLTMPVPQVAARRPGELDRVPDFVEEIVARALAKKPAERFTMAEMHAALSDALTRLQQRGHGKPLAGISVVERISRQAHKLPTLSTSADEVGRLVDRLAKVRGHAGHTQEEGLGVAIAGPAPSRSARRLGIGLAGAACVALLCALALYLRTRQPGRAPVPRSSPGGSVTPPALPSSSTGAARSTGEKAGPVPASVTSVPEEARPKAGPRSRNRKNLKRDPGNQGLAPDPNPPRPPPAEQKEESPPAGTLITPPGQAEEP